MFAFITFVIFKNDRRRGELIATQLLIDYYKIVKDTTNYIRAVDNLASWNLMLMSNDSLKALDFRERENDFDEAIEWQKKAVERNEKNEMKSSNYQKELDKMLQRKL